MLSSTKLKSLLDKKEYQEFQKVLDEHFSSEAKFEASSCQKLTNLIAYEMKNQKKFDVSIFSIWVKYFQIALDCLCHTEIDDSVLLNKVFSSCYHVSLMEFIFETCVFHQRCNDET